MSVFEIEVVSDFIYLSVRRPVEHSVTVSYDGGLLLGEATDKDWLNWFTLTRVIDQHKIQVLSYLVVRELSTFFDVSLDQPCELSRLTQELGSKGT